MSGLLKSIIFVILLILIKNFIKWCAADCLKTNFLFPYHWRIAFIRLELKIENGILLWLFLLDSSVITRLFYGIRSHRYPRNFYETNHTFILHCYLFVHHIRKAVSVSGIYVIVRGAYLTLRFRVRKKEV